MRYVLQVLKRSLAFNQELLTLFVIALVVFLGATGDYLGLSKEVGTFLRTSILLLKKIKRSHCCTACKYKRFLALFFFIDLGPRLELANVGPRVSNAIYIPLFVLIGKLFIMMTIMGIMGYRMRTGFMAGLTVAQIFF